MTARQSEIERSTRETKVSIRLDIDGTGKFLVDSDIQFLRHMTETLARYASFDLEMTASGDNDHHIIEDCAITLGKALRQALGDTPIERMATAVVPMDDALVMASLDLVDRPYADIDLPDPLYTHYLRSLAMSAGMTLHIVVIRGFDEHHIVEAAFKAVGKALSQAVRVRGEELSTKDREVIG
ncbi:MAG: imidazoleglycerol-phosphate dehydratase [Thermoplasmata archaeon]|nr:imidazoleglycerol-phosphate dehydratase [Thermoplasmata archaeon]